jgi:hypothetical protein
MSICRPLTLIILSLGLMSSMNVFSEEIDYDLEDIEVSYIYAALMGTGTYNIDGRRITMLRLPFSWTQRKMTESRAGFKWNLPVVIGSDKLPTSDWFDELFPDKLVTLTVLPGFEYQKKITPRWTVKPFGHIGLTRDFSSHETVRLGVLGISSVGLYELNEDWRLRWGNKVRFAVEYQTKSNFKTSFGIIETGFDIRRDTGFVLFEHKIDASVYYRLQIFIPEWNVSEAPDRHSDLDNLHEIGFSVGFKKPRKILGFTVNRVRFGYKRSDDIRGFTIGGEFPF